MADLLILSRLKQRVETGLPVLMMVFALSASALAVERNEGGERHEPDPWPQVEIPAHSDFGEAKALLSKRKWEEAAIVLRSLMKRSPDFVPGAIELARALAYLGRREEALTLLAQVVQRQKGTRREAIADRVEVLSRIFFTKKTFQAYQEGLNLVRQQKYRSARESFDRALAIEPDNVEILARLGQCLVLDGDHDSAAERLRLAKRLNPYEPEVNLWLGRALHQRGELPQAVEELRVAYEGLKGSERAPLWYAEALVAAGSRRGAVQVLESDAEARPEHLKSLIALARIRIELFRDGADSLWSARKDLQVALSRMPQYAAPERPRAEGDLGIELKTPSNDLKSEITGLLAQLDGRLRDTAPRPAKPQKQ